MSRKTAVSTAEARTASTDNTKADLNRARDVLCEIPVDNRDQRNEVWKDLQKTFHPDTLKFVELTTLREKQHYYFMNEILPKMPKEDYVFAGRKPHDHSKEGVFFFALPAFFDGGIKGENLKAMVDAELKRHYVLEPHHPEYELHHNGEECQRQDIVEMAVDRLARNAQFGDGLIRLDSLEKFKPKFPLGDNEAKQKIFWDAAVKYQDFVQKEWYAMFPESRDWLETK